MVWSVHVEDNAGLGGALAQFPAGVSSSNPRYVTVSGYAPITLIEGMSPPSLLLLLYKFSSLSHHLLVTSLSYSIVQLVPRLSPKAGSSQCSMATIKHSNLGILKAFISHPLLIPMFFFLIFYHLSFCFSFFSLFCFVFF